MTDLKDMPTNEVLNKLFAILSEETVENLADAYGEDFGNYNSLWQEYMYASGAEKTADSLTAKVVAEYGGEGKGEEYWMVVSLTDGTTTRYFRKDGWYASYSGGEFDGDAFEVKPVERMVTFYE